MTGLYSEARKHAAQGRCVIPIGSNKKAAVKWKQYQTQRPDEATLRKWFQEQKGVTGLAVVCGAVSGNLAVRDFDLAQAYERWKAAFPGLAGKCPTVRTHRGYHVYIRTPSPTPTVELDDGELRGEGAYVMAPPSPHPSGGTYEWVIPLTDELPPMVHELECSGLLGDCNTENTDNAENTEILPPASSEQIRKLVDECPVSRHRLCILTGINTGNMTAFMAGQRGLSLDSLDALGEVLGFKVTMDKAAARRLAAEAPAPGRPPAQRAQRSK